MKKIENVPIDLFPIDLQFSVFNSEEIKRMSVVKVITGVSFDALGHALPGGLYDNLMGAHGRNVEACGTCFKLQNCPGHIGHIELNALVYNPFFIQALKKLCNLFCSHCHMMQIPERTIEIVTLQLKLIDAGYILEAQELEPCKSDTSFQNEVKTIKQENGESIPSKFAAAYQLLKSGQQNHVDFTKTTCALRTAIVNNTLQRSLNKKCMHCGEHLRNVRYLQRKLVHYMGIAELKSAFPNHKGNIGQNKVILADEMRTFLHEVYKNYAQLLELLYPILKITNKPTDTNASPIDIFFIDTLIVTPPNSRPMNVVSGKISEHHQTDLYRSIIECNNILKVIIQSIKNENEEMLDNLQIIYNSTKGSTAYEKLYNSWQELQSAVNVLLDEPSTKNVTCTAGIKQIIEKKEGLLRKHMMGKRVNYAARTVITPDPNINVEEVGVPDAFARKLSYPVPVTPWNVAELRKYVINGPDIYPGANYIQDAKGATIIIPNDDPRKRQSMAKLLYNKPEKGIKIVHRHILNGDILLLNRQPSLHRPSIMAHRARILKGEKTFRLHYSNCKAYNADFDGDEMNAHVPQNEVARSEAYNLVNVASNYLVPKDGTPLGGLIQDHVIAGVKLSMRGRFFNREDYQQLVFQGLSHLNRNVKLLPPAIIKPCCLWSGKQIISTIIINFIPEGCDAINLKSHAKIVAKHWRNAKAKQFNWKNDLMSESTVIIKHGELLVGVLDKQQYGATTFGLIHCVYELYGGEVSTGLLTSLTKLFTAFLQSEGFTLGVKDILISKEADRERHQIIKCCRNNGMAAAASALDIDDVPPLDILAEKLESAYIKDPNFRIVLDRKYKYMLDNYTNDINGVCLPDGLISKFPENNLQLMVLSGAKGSMVNTMQISCLLGQIELEGKRPPLMISGKSLPSFPSFETSPKSGGFIDGRFLTGIQPQDFFFHCMAGREGLIDTAVKTSRSGYLQRCLIKHLEGLTVNYDLTVRDSDNTIIQFLYGEDGLDILKSKFFTSQFGWRFLDENSNVILCPDELEEVKNDEDFAKIMDHNKKLHSWLKRKRKNTRLAHTKLLSAFTNFTAELDKDIEVKHPNKINKRTGRRCIDQKLVKLWQKVDKETKTSYEKKYPRCPDPINSIYKPDTTFGSVSEKIQQIVANYIKEHPERKMAIANIMYLKNTKSLAAPGESVGLLAAQSIGEPSTQMTLNTFHFAGRGEMNVTLGIPRLREILMLASANIKTPSMDIPIKCGQEKAANKLRLSLNRVTLADVLQNIQVKTQLILEPHRYQRYELTFQILPHSVYNDDYCVKPKQILKYIGNKFAPLLFKNILKTKKDKRCVIEVGETEKLVDGNEDEQLDYNEDNDNEGAVASRNAKSKSGENQVAEKDANDSSDDEIGEDDNDATGIKLKERKLDENEYDDVEEVNDISDVDEVISANGDVVVVDIDEDITEKAEVEAEAEAEAEAIITDDLINNKMVENYIYDKENYSWAKLIFTLKMEERLPNISSIIKDLAHKAVIHQVNNIKRAIIYSDHKGEQLLKTDGINIIEMFKYNKILDLNNLYSNDIHAMASTYGIEAAAQVIVREIMNVFKVYGISIDHRHLSLIADYMTFNGAFQPLSRKGMEHSASPLQQMSFETCLQFLRNAATNANGDRLLSPSSRLMVGLPVKNGTGCFDLFVKIC